MNTQKMKSLTTADLVYQLLVQLGQDCCLHWKDFQTLSNRYRSEGLSFITKTLPKLSKAMLAGLGSGRFSLPSNFKRRPGTALPAFLGSLFAKVFSKKGMLLPDACPTAITRIRQVCEFAYKADLPRDRKTDNAVIEGFVEVEKELSNLRIDWDPILVLANALTREVFAQFDRKKLNCKHGPGVTANVSLMDKFIHQLNPTLSSVKEFGEYFFFNVHDGMTRTHRYPVWSHSDYFRSRNTAKVILVSKDSRGPRLISCEPAENQWIQQGIANYMISTLEHHSFTKGHVNFLDQEVNRTLAKEHSVTKAYSTLDLKDASDRVSMQLVNKLFDGTDLLRALTSVRSEYTILPDGRKLLLNKHAPMGSALCFPVMATTIYMLTISGLLGLGLNLKQAVSSVYVYGDDVVVATPYASFTIDLLERYGLRVNKDKSFINSFFLESCGYDAFKGVSVNITRVKKCQVSDDLLKKRPSTLVSLTEAANLYAKSGFGRASQFLYEYAACWLGPLPYGHEDSPYLCRWVLNPSERELIPEMNFLTSGIRWRKARLTKNKPLGYNPLGSEMRAWQVRPAKSYKPWGARDFYGHLMRIWGSIGDEGTSPLIGEFTLPRQYSLTQVWCDHYDMSVYSESTGQYDLDDYRRTV